ncbi:hypothetical protein LZ31DRAFT_203005 [Colletotrichum somersetense]|nr:hypothetical protein LZ31DRAFT_203005 [Colletotrichum somersetense]
MQGARAGCNRGATGEGKTKRKIRGGKKKNKKKGPVADAEPAPTTVHLRAPRMGFQTGRQHPLTRTGIIQVHTRSYIAVTPCGIKVSQANPGKGEEDAQSRRSGDMPAGYCIRPPRLGYSLSQKLGQRGEKRRILQMRPTVKPIRRVAQNKVTHRKHKKEHGCTPATLHGPPPISRKRKIRMGRERERERGEGRGGGGGQRRRRGREQGKNSAMVSTVRRNGNQGTKIFSSFFSTPWLDGVKLGANKNEK